MNKDENLKGKEDEILKLKSSLKGTNVYVPLCRTLWSFVSHLEAVQRLDPELRLKYWEIAFHVYDYLRRKGEMDRKAHGFSVSTMNFLRRVINE